MPPMIVKIQSRSSKPRFATFNLTLEGFLCQAKAQVQVDFEAADPKTSTPGVPLATIVSTEYQNVCVR